MKRYDLQLFAGEDIAFCNFSSSSAKAMAGKDILLAVYNDAGIFRHVLSPSFSVPWFNW